MGNLGIPEIIYAILIVFVIIYMICIFKRSFLTKNKTNSVSKYDSVSEGKIDPVVREMPKNESPISPIKSKDDAGIR
jgi:phage terminase large subunit GpA-like protein